MITSIFQISCDRMVGYELCDQFVSSTEELEVYDEDSLVQLAEPRGWLIREGHHFCPEHAKE
jgi:hypothetical protein